MDQYRQKMVSADRAAQAIVSGDHVYVGVFNPYPAAVIRALISRLDAVTDVKLFDIPCPHPSIDYFQDLLAIPDSEKHIKAITAFTTHPAQRQLIQSGRGDQIPAHFRSFPSCWTRSGPQLMWLWWRCRRPIMLASLASE